MRDNNKQLIISAMVEQDIWDFVNAIAEEEERSRSQIIVRLIKMGIAKLNEDKNVHSNT